MLQAEGLQAEGLQAERGCRCQFRSIASMYRLLNDDPDGELSEVCGCAATERQQ